MSRGGDVSLIGIPTVKLNGKCRTEIIQYLNNTPKIFTASNHAYATFFILASAVDLKMTNTDDEYADDDKKEDADFPARKRRTSTPLVEIRQITFDGETILHLYKFVFNSGTGQNDAKENNDNEKNKEKVPLRARLTVKRAREQKGHAKHLDPDTIRGYTLIKGDKIFSREASG